MRILCVSDAVVPDLHRPSDAQRFGKIDLLLSCGDLPPEYLSQLVGTFDAPLYYIRGNHDIRYDQSPPRGCVDIHGRVVRHGTLKILGLEGSRWYNGGPFQYTEKQMAMMVWRLRPSLWWHRGWTFFLPMPRRGISTMPRISVTEGFPFIGRSLPGMLLAIISMGISILISKVMPTG